MDFSCEATKKVGTALLKKASDKGHKEATFVLGMVLLSQGGQKMKEGLELLNSTYEANMPFLLHL